MKKLLAIIMCFFLGHAFAQTYLTMLDEGNIWNIDTYHCPWTSTPPYNWTITEALTINGTQEINGVTYKQIYNDQNISCLLREENGIVYKYWASNNEERVLFDFNLEVGDIFDLFSSAYHSSPCAGEGNGSAPFSIEVFDIETSFIAGENRKVIKFIDHYFPAGEEIRWIEGIGSTAGLIGPWGAWDVTCSSELACFESQGVSYFMNGATSCDNTTLNVNEFSSEEIILYPNPVVGKSILQFPSEGIIDSIKVYNLNGQLIKEENIYKDYYTIEGMSYRSGLYFYQVLSEEKIIKTEKFIVN